MYCPKCGKEIEQSEECPYCGIIISKYISRAQAVQAPDYDRQTAESSASPTLAETSYSGFWLRFAAHFIDGFVISLASFLLLIPLILATGISGGAKNPGAAISMVFLFDAVLIVLIWLYYALMESSSKQATLGKMALGIVVTDLEGQKITFGRATGRYFAKIISYLTLYIGFIMAGFTRKKQALHDKIASTLVVSARQGRGWIIAVIIIVFIFFSIAIVGILAAIAIPNFLRYQTMARRVEAKKCLTEISAAQNAFYMKNNRYAANLEELGWKNASAQPVYKYSLDTTVADPNAGTISGFTAHAVGNIDSDPDMDVWSINDSGQLVNEHNDLTPRNVTQPEAFAP